MWELQDHGSPGSKHLISPLLQKRLANQGQLPMAMAGMAMGGHVRVGLEDNIYYSKGTLAKNNAELVDRVIRIAKEFGRDVAKPLESRKILSLR